MAEPDFVSDVLTTNPMLFPPGKGSDNKAGGGERTVQKHYEGLSRAQDLSCKWKNKKKKLLETKWVYWLM